MKKRLLKLSLFFCLLIFVITSLSLLWAMVLRPISPRVGPVPIDLADGWEISTPDKEGFDEQALQKSILALLDSPLNVHSVLVERHGRLVTEYYQGGKDRSVYGLFSTRYSFGPTDKHDVRSIGKSVNSLLFGIALQQGKVPQPSSSVLSYYPKLSDIATEEKRRIRVEDLLNMANGLRWHEGDGGINDELHLYWEKDIARYVLNHEMDQEPNTAFNYNGGGTAILADMISHGTNQSLDEFARTNLFEPLGIKDWEWVSDIYGRPMAFNGLRMRPRDLLKIGRLVTNRGQWQGKEIVPNAWITASMTPHFSTNVRDYRYGYQWWAGQAKWQTHNVLWYAGFGNGGQRLYIVPELDLVIVTTAGAYDQLPTAIRVNDLIQEIVSSIKF